MNNENVYQTKDLYLASFLLSKKVALLSVDPALTGSFYWFSFANKKKCKELENSFWSGVAMIEIQTYLNSFRALKQRLYMNKR